MNIQSLAVAKAEAKRFLRRVEALEHVLAKDPLPYISHHPTESGAVRRASMDLTRALAKMRKPG